MKTPDHGLEAGAVASKQFDLLLAGTSIRSEPLIDALRDHLVHGCTATEAWTKHGINPSQFSRRLAVIQAESERTKALSVFYPKE